MIDWIKLSTGVALMLPGAASLFWGAWWFAKEHGYEFSEFVKLALAFVAGVVLLLGLPIMAGMGGYMIWEAFQ